MKRSKFSEEQVAYALRQVEAGTPVADVCRQLGVSEATFYAWKKKYAHLGVSELRRLRQLEDENMRLKRLVADLTLDKHMLSEALRKAPEARAPSGARRMVSGDVPGQLCAGLSAGTVEARGVVSPQPSAGSVCTAVPDSRARARAASLWLPAHLGTAAPRRVARESQAGAPTLPTRRLAGPHAGSAAQTHGAASGGQPRHRRGPPNGGAWTLCMMPWPMAGHSGS